MSAVSTTGRVEAVTDERFYFGRASCNNIEKALEFDSRASTRPDAIAAIDDALLEDDGRPSSSAMASASTVVAIAGSACFATWMGVHFVPPTNLFAWHPLLMSAAIGACGASAALSVRARAMAPGRARLATLWAHLWLNAAGTACWLLGFYAIYANKNKLGKPHFATTHGSIGMWSTLALVVTVALGLASFNALGVLARFGWTAATRKVKAAHRALGLFVVFAAMFTASLNTGHSSVGYGAGGKALSDVALGAAAASLGVAAFSTPAWSAKP